MDLESECLALESVEDNEVIITRERMVNVSETKIENNGSCRVEPVDDKLLVNTTVEGVVTEFVNSPPLMVHSPRGLTGSPPPATMKGYGLKKWRRIKRDSNKDGDGNVDSCRILKRGLANSSANSTKPMVLLAEMKKKSEGSVSPTNAMVHRPVVGTDGFAVLGDSGLVGPSFAAGTDSKNSEDRSSKSSTAASGPQLRQEIPSVVGYARDKNRMRSVGGRNLGNLVQWGQQGKGRIETSKKPRGERVKIEKENSHSSVGSDSGSSNFVFMQGANSVTSNGRQSRSSANYDGENSDEAEGVEHHFSEELRTGFRKNVADFEDVSQQNLAADSSWDVKEEKSENHGSTTDRDPLVESIITLQSTQEALEKEVEKLRDIGKEDILLFDDSVQGSSLPPEFTSVDPKANEPSSSDQLQSGKSRQSSSHSLETEMNSLKQNVNFLEIRLEEARTMLEVKEAKVTELEATLNSSKSPIEETGGTIELQQEIYSGMETEFEGLFKQKIEAEVEYLVISRTIQSLRVAAVDQITLLEEQKNLASEQAQMVSKLEDAESKATMLKREAEKLETHCGDLVGADEVLKMRKRVSKFTEFLFIQLILLVVVVGLLVLKLLPHDVGVVPT